MSILSIRVPTSASATHGKAFDKLTSSDYVQSVRENAANAFGVIIQIQSGGPETLDAPRNIYNILVLVDQPLALEAVEAEMADAGSKIRAKIGERLGKNFLGIVHFIPDDSYDDSDSNVDPEINCKIISVVGNDRKILEEITIGTEDLVA